MRTLSTQTNMFGNRSPEYNFHLFILHEMTYYVL